VALFVAAATDRRRPGRGVVAVAAESGNGAIMCDATAGAAAAGKGARVTSGWVATPGSDVVVVGGGGATAAPAAPAAAGAGASTINALPANFGRGGGERIGKGPLVSMIIPCSRTPAWDPVCPRGCVPDCTTPPSF